MFGLKRTGIMYANDLIHVYQLTRNEQAGTGIGKLSKIVAIGSRISLLQGFTIGSMIPVFQAIDNAMQANDPYTTWTDLPNIIKKLSTIAGALTLCSCANLMVDEMGDETSKVLTEKRVYFEGEEGIISKRLN